MSANACTLTVVSIENFIIKALEIKGIILVQKYDNSCPCCITHGNSLLLSLIIYTVKLQHLLFFNY